MYKTKKGFTLIELIAVLVIMAIIALIATPLVMNIIRKARIAADKRSIDAYGRSIELAIAGYLLDTGKFPTEVSQLTIEYSGNQVVCSTTKINSDSSVYLAGCTVAGRSVDGYTYGKEETVPTPTYTAYSVGDTVTYNNVQYRVIEDSSTSDASVTLLKAEPLSYEEVQTYSNGTGAQTYDQNGYGGMQYHSSSNNYETSYIKTTVDAWKQAQAPAASEARLITEEEYEALCDIETYETPTTPGTRYVPQYDWIYNSNYCYWTMSQHQDSASGVCYVSNDGTLNTNDADIGGGVVRPVITISKSALSS